MWVCGVGWGAVGGGRECARAEKLRAAQKKDQHRRTVAPDVGRRHVARVWLRVWARAYVLASLTADVAPPYFRM